MPPLATPLLSEQHLAPLPPPGARSGAPTIEVHAPSTTALSAFSAGADALSRRVHLVSLAANVVLFFAKVYAYMSSGSMAVLASLVDSTVDLLAQGILLAANRLVTLADANSSVLYPAGRSRLEPVGVIACALVMAMASAQVIRDALGEIIAWAHGGGARAISLSAVDCGLLGGTIALKAWLWLYCDRMAKRTGNVTVEAVAQDNANDVLSNAAALVAAGLTKVPLGASLWLADPIGAVVIGVYIIYSWASTGMEQLQMVIGKTAEAEFLDLVREMAETHDPAASLDIVRAYHFGPKFLVEVEIVMDAATPLRESHDTGIMLQHKIERLQQVDRCFVHVDYMAREADDHDPETPLDRKITVSPAPQ